jgi:hypothetical protein
VCVCVFYTCVSVCVNVYIVCVYVVCVCVCVSCDSPAPAYTHTHIYSWKNNLPTSYSILQTKTSCLGCRHTPTISLHGPLSVWRKSNPSWIWNELPSNGHALQCPTVIWDIASGLMCWVMTRMTIMWLALIECIGRSPNHKSASRQNIKFTCKIKSPLFWFLHKGHQWAVN